MFLPAAGYFVGKSFNSGGSLGSYWSSTLDNSTDGCFLYFNGDGVYPQDYGSCCLGFSVRAVRSVSE